mgnify:CR=1 FL=1
MKQQIKLYRSLFPLLLLLLLPQLANADKDYERLFIFGDSLSDPGNAFALTGNLLTPPYASLDALLIPDAPYAVGRGRFSNGRTWIERLARSLEVKASARPAYAFNAKGRRGDNFAVGGARARSVGRGFDLADQVGFHLSRPLDEEIEEALYVVAMGGNDVRDALTAFDSDPTGASSTAIITDAILAIGDNVGALYASGAREFFIVNSPDISLTPAVRTLDANSPGTRFVASLITTQFNTALEQLTDQLRSQLPGVSIALFNLQSLLNRVSADPEMFRLINVTDACIMPNQPPFRCRKAKRYLFWDGIHPTKTGHKIFAHFAYEMLAEEDDDEEETSEHRHCENSEDRRRACR